MRVSGDGLTAGARFKRTAVVALDSTEEQNSEVDQCREEAVVGVYVGRTLDFNTGFCCFFPFSNQQTDFVFVHKPNRTYLCHILHSH